MRLLRRIRHNACMPVEASAIPQLRQNALRAFLETNPEAKTSIALVAAQELATTFVVFKDLTDDDNPTPGRPVLPPLVHPAKVPRRAPSTLEGRAALVHAILHIEFNAINLALDAVWRFAGMPETFYADWALVAQEEAYHFGLLRQHLRRMKTKADGSPQWDYGDFDAHDSLWATCEATRHDIVARMALVPRTLEARGLDATPQMQAKLRQIGTQDALQAVEILHIILRDEVGHVAIGNHWYRWLCKRDGLDPVEHYDVLCQRYKVGRLKPPFNTDARLRAGFTATEIAAL
jgi:uncharacterized ferritin-like protein (DUF455 family)